MNPLCTGFGQYDTHSSGKQNTAALAGQPYTSVTEADILAMVQDPQSIHKDDAQWFIPSDYLAIKGGGGDFVPASSPLAQSTKEARRVMRLRGYGNAIVPQAAALFIRAFDDVLTPQASRRRAADDGRRPG